MTLKQYNERSGVVEWEVERPDNEDAIPLEVEYEVGRYYPARGISGPPEFAEEAHGGEIERLTIKHQETGQPFELTDQEMEALESYIYDHHED